LYDMRIRDGVHQSKRIPWNFAQALSALQARVGSTLLDIGCAEGQFLHLAQKTGFNVTGIDFNPASLRVARELFKIASVHQCSAEELGSRFPELRFDCITMFEVLEHTSNPFAVVCAVRRLLKPDGTFVMSVPGYRRWPQLFHPQVDAPPHHLTLWTDEALRTLLERAGFRVLTLRSKPLGPDDLGIHLKWRFHRFARRFSQSRHQGQVGTPKISAAPCSSDAIQTNTLLRSVAWAALVPACWGLRLHGRAGGFTLFAECQAA
jgi:SAM-dependent methyltransferase